MKPKRPVRAPDPAERGYDTLHPYRRVRSAGPALAATLLIGLAASACGASAAAQPPAEGSTTAPVEATEVEESAPAEEPTATTTTVEVDGEAWFAGFHITFGTA